MILFQSLKSVGLWTWLFQTIAWNQVAWNWWFQWISCCHQVSSKPWVSIVVTKVFPSEDNQRRGKLLLQGAYLGGTRMHKVVYKPTTPKRSKHWWLLGHPRHPRKSSRSSCVMHHVPYEKDWGSPFVDTLAPTPVGWAFKCCGPVDASVGGISMYV